jgi:hypothetical protein
MLLITEFIRAWAQHLYPTLAEQIVGMILEFPLDMLLPVVTSQDNLVRNINAAATRIGYEDEEDYDDDNDYEDDDDNDYEDDQRLLQTVSGRVSGDVVTIANDFSPTD